jgi:Putative transposase of IS4/5 family (DUF4096)
MNLSRTPYPTDVNDDEWAFVAPYLTLLPEDGGQRIYSLREVLNGLRWLARAGAPWRMMPNDLPPWWVVYQQTRALGWQQAVLPRWLTTYGCSCAKPKDAPDSPRQPSLIVAPDNQRRKVATCWLCWSLLPMSRTARKWASWLPPCKR